MHVAEHRAVKVHRARFNRLMILSCKLIITVLVSIHLKHFLMMISLWYFDTAYIYFQVLRIKHSVKIIRQNKTVSDSNMPKTKQKWWETNFFILRNQNLKNIKCLHRFWRTKNTLCRKKIDWILEKPEQKRRCNMDWCI